MAGSCAATAAQQASTQDAGGRACVGGAVATAHSMPASARGSVGAGPASSASCAGEYTPAIRDAGRGSCSTLADQSTLVRDTGSKPLRSGRASSRRASTACSSGSTNCRVGGRDIVAMAHMLLARDWSLMAAVVAPPAAPPAPAPSCWAACSSCPRRAVRRCASARVASGSCVCRPMLASVSRMLLMSWLLSAGTAAVTQSK